MRKRFIVFLAIIFLYFIFFATKANAFTLVIDPGHGGSDPGAKSENNTYESYYTMKISQYLKEYLSKYDMNIYLTHEGKTMDILDRALYARSKNADLVVSIHLNALADGKTSSGAEVWVTRSTVLSKYQEKTTALGDKILNNLYSSMGIHNRGVQICNPRSDPTDVYSDGTRADYYGIICYSMRGCKIDEGEIKPAGAVPARIEKGEGVPAIIIEHCFCRGSDYQYIDSDEELKKLAEADGQAIVECYNLQLKAKLVYIDGSWYCVRNGVIDRTATTLVNHNGKWYYVQNGELKWGKNTLVNYYNTTYYVKNSTLEWGINGLTYIDGKWYYLKNSAVQKNYTGLVYYNKNWYYVQNGVLNWGIRTLVKYNGTWYYVKNSTLDWNYTGFCEYNGTEYYIQRGTLKWEVDGLTYIDGTWYYLKNSTMQKNYTGLVYYSKNWYYVKNSILDWNYTGLCEYNETKYYIQKGSLKWGVNGLTYIDETWYYLKDSSLQKTYTGLVEYNMNLYYVQNGILIWGYEGSTVYNDITYTIKNSIAFKQ